MIKISHSRKKTAYFLVTILLFLILTFIVITLRRSAGTIKIEARQNKDYSCKFQYGQYDLIEIPGVVKGKTYNLLFDTGADHSLMRVHVPGIRNGNMVAVTDVKGETRNENIFIIDTLTLTPFDILGHFFIQAESKTGASDGIVGMDILKNFIVRINFVSQTIDMKPAGSVFDLDKLQRIPIQFVDGRPYITLAIDGVETTFLVDTGFTGFADVNTNIAVKQLKSKLIDWKGYDDRQTFRVKSDSLRIIKYAKKTVNVGFLNHILANEIVHYADRKQRNHAIGLDFFKRFDKVVFDFSREAIYVGVSNKKSLRHYLESLYYLNSPGIIFNNDSLPKITQTAEWLVNKQIKIGDTIVGFDGKILIDKKAVKPISELYRIDKRTGRSEFIRLIRNARFSQSDANISILKNGKVLEVNLKRQKLLKFQDEYIDYFIPGNNIADIPPMTGIQLKGDNFWIYKPLATSD